MFRKNISLKIEQIYNDYNRLIFSIAYKLVKDYQAAEDITQETIKKMIENPQGINRLEGNELRNYVARIALNTGYDYLRKINKKVVYIEDLSEGEQDIKDSVDVEDFVITRYSIEQMKTEIRNLDNKYRDPLTLHNLDEHTISEVAMLLSVPERTVKYRINKAIKILKEVLRKGGGKDEQG